ncbi:hypothetical protein MNSC_00930 [Minisyncoccus archaeophilus]|uniref:fibrinogen-like YCDxxxxGGGW domain-containing protein n=1 Tax=Minisyncoccus archaeiphilus TaxID=3238481 RepID=UPI00399CF995
MTSTTNSFNLNWTKGSSTNTVIRRSINTPPQNQEQGTLVYNSTSSSFTDTDITLTKNTTYCYSIWSYNPTTASLSTEYLSSCGTLSNMATPTNLSFPTVAYNSIILNWTPGTGSTNTLIVRKQGSIPTSRTDGTTIYEDNGNAFIDTGLTDNTEYCYALYATDGTEYTEALTGCQTTVQAYSSCSELKASGVNNNGVYPIKVNGNTFNAYCDMTTDGGGWTLVLAQYEDDPVTNWNEGIQGDYDPSLVTRKGFALNTSQIPSHNQVAFGKDLNPTFVDYADFTYSTGNIPVTTLTSPKTRKGYQIFRNGLGSYYYGDPEHTTYMTESSYSIWFNSLTFDELNGSKYSWDFSPMNSNSQYRGYSINAAYLPYSSESYAWTVWVRDGTVETVKSSCSEWKSSGANTNGFYKISPSGTPFLVYCDMTTDGGGWTLISAQFESDPSVNWNEGIQSDYNPSLYGSHSFNLNTSQIPSHNQVAFGKDLNPTEMDYVNFNYTTGNIPVNLVSSPKTGNNYQIHRSTSNYYNAHDPEQPIYNSADWNNTLTCDKVGGAMRSWSFSPNHGTASSRGYSLNGATSSTTESYSWTVWVRTGIDSLGFSCLDVKNKGYNTDGYYSIDPDGVGGTTPFVVYCDMTTDGGGWTRIMHSGTSIAELGRYGSTSQITNLRNHATYGIGWGNNNTTNGVGWNNPSYGLYSGSIPFSFSSVRFHLYAPYNEDATLPSYNMAGCLGEVYIYDDNSSNGYEVWVSDGSSGAVYGQTYAKRGVNVFYSQQIVVNENISYSDWQGKLNISIHGYYNGTSTYPVCNSFIGNLYVR